MRVCPTHCPVKAANEAADADGAAGTVFVVGATVAVTEVGLVVVPGTADVAADVAVTVTVTALGEVAAAGAADPQPATRRGRRASGARARRSMQASLGRSAALP
jgi:hypothetical protein